MTYSSSVTNRIPAMARLLCAAAAALLAACSSGSATSPSSSPSLTGRWIGEEVWGTTAQVNWSASITQTPGSTALLGTAVAALEPPNFDVNGVVLSATSVSMNFVSQTGRTGGRTFHADLTLSADGNTLSGPITPGFTTAPATITLRRQPE